MERDFSEKMFRTFVKNHFVSLWCAKTLKGDYSVPGRENTIQRISDCEDIIDYCNMLGIYEFQQSDIRPVAEEMWDEFVAELKKSEILDAYNI